MARKVLSRSKLSLLAANFAGAANIAALHSLISQYPKELDEVLLYRILLSYLPEYLESNSYSYLIEYLVFDRGVPISESRVEALVPDEVSEDEALRLVQELHLLPLAWPHASCNISTDNHAAFLLHRSIRVDESTGLINQIPALLNPFFRSYPCLLNWTVSTILPLIRLGYEYYPDDSRYITIQKFNELDDRAAVYYLLARTSSDEKLESDSRVGRDLRGIIGPWLLKEKRQINLKSLQNKPHSANLRRKLSRVNEKYIPWEETYLWIINQAETSWKTATDTIHGWNGPGDYDLGGYSAEIPLTEEEQAYLKSRYIRTAIATAYTIAEDSQIAHRGIHRILVRVSNLLDSGNPPSLESACRLLAPIKDIDSDIISQLSIRHLKTLMEDGNPLTAPKDSSVNFLQALLISAVLCERLGYSTSVRNAAMLIHHENENLQRIFFHNLIREFNANSNKNDEYFVKFRNELLWLRSWGVVKTQSDTGINIGNGIFGRLSNDFIEIEYLKVLLYNGRYYLAQSLYETPQNQILPHNTLHDVVLEAALSQYDNATNANISRGGLKRCNDILKAFSKTLSSSAEYHRIQILLQVTSDIEPYRLVLKKDEHFRPINLRNHGDPIIILGKIMEQNPKSYTKVAEFVEIAKNMVQAGLIKDQNQQSVIQEYSVQNKLVNSTEKRIVSMCIDAALAEDDFETAYSYVTSRLKPLAHSEPTKYSFSSQAVSSQAGTSSNRSDEWMWRAALQAGKYYGNIEITNLINTRDTNHRNQEVYQLTKRMDCISLALELAPKESLQGILNVYLRCEEELESSIIKEAENSEENLEYQAKIKNLPEDSLSNRANQNTTSTGSYQIEEEPITLFDLSRAGMLRAQDGLSAFSLLNSKQSKGNSQVASGNKYGSVDNSDESGTETVTGNRIRKRDQLKNAAVGGIATGVGWLIGATVPKDSMNNDR